MSSLHFFNPDNDLALARGVENYTPPRAALLLRQAGESLPFWYGAEGDMVWTRGINERWLETMRDAFGLQTRVFDHKYLPGLAFKPWGWSAAMRKAFIDDGCPETLLPSKAQVEKIRQLSHRRTGAQIAAELMRRLPGVKMTPAALEARSEEELMDMLGRIGNAVVKAPWSGSGRGVVNTRKGMAEAMQVARDSLRLQGSVMVELEHEKVLDFAKIFRCECGKCQCLGTSVFLTDSHQRYLGNLLATEAVRLDRVRLFCDLGDLNETSRELTSIIEEKIAPHYDGVLGVDMLACADGTIDPVVELNLRCTMGYVANVIADNYLCPGATGKFEVMALKGVGEMGNPLKDAVVRDGKIEGGSLFLTPSVAHFGFKVTVD